MQSIEWRQIPGLKSWYEVSNDGRMRSVDHVTIDFGGNGHSRRVRHIKGRILKTLLNKEGYLQVGLEGRTIGIHRAVALAFLGDSNGRESCHNNGNSLDNRLSNIRWGTRSENALDAVQHGTHPLARMTECGKGHPFDAGNTYFTKQGTRRCRTCDAARELIRTRRRLQERIAARLT